MCLGVWILFLHSFDKNSDMIGMRRHGSVSLWIGNAPSDRQLDDYVRLTYSDDGDLVPSQFMQDLRLARWNDSCREAECVGTTSSLATLLSGVSYAAEIIPQFERTVGRVLNPPCSAFVLEGKKGSGLFACADTVTSSPEDSRTG